jgi:hypothetical protein
MSDRFTRTELLRRSALGGVAISLPGILAACGGDNGSASTALARGQLSRSFCAPMDTGLMPSFSSSSA